MSRKLNIPYDGYDKAFRISIFRYMEVCVTTDGDTVQGVSSCGRHAFFIPCKKIMTEETMKKKFAVLIMASVMGLSCIAGFAGCGGDTGNGGNGGTGGNEQTKEHTLVAHAAKDATCTEDGNKAYWECTDCGKLFSDKDGESETTLSAVTIAAKGHTLEKTEGTSATCKDEGTITYWTCTTCHKLYSDAEGKTEIEKDDTIIPATGNHTFGEWLYDGEGHWKECSVCGDTTEKAEHDFGDGLTCTECGYEYDPAKDTAPTTIEELFPDETTATAIELARAEYYQAIVVNTLNDNLLGKMLSNIIGNYYELNKVDNVKWRVTTVEDNSTIDKIYMTFDYNYDHNGPNTSRTFKYASVDPVTDITITDLINNDTEKLEAAFDEGNPFVAGAKYVNEYVFNYNPSIQEKRSELLDAVNKKLAEDGIITAVDQNTQSFIKDIGSGVNPTLNGTAREIVVMNLTENGYEEVSIIIKETQNNNNDITLMEHLNKGEYYEIESARKSGVFSGAILENINHQ